MEGLAIDLDLRGIDSELKDYLNKLICESSLFYQISEWYTLNSMSLEQYILQLGESREKDVFLARLEGKTLQEIGDSFGLTRERVRQISMKIIRRIPKLREDIFSEVFCYFHFKKNDFLRCFKIDDERIYEYLSIKYKHGSHSIIEDIKNYNGVLKDIIALYSPEEKKKKITKWDVCREAILNNAGQYISKEKLETQYYELIKQKGLNREKYEANMSGFLSKLREIKHIAFNKEGEFRYYEYDAAELWGRIDFSSYNNSVLSTELIFKENKSLMDEYDIWNGYELYHLLKATADKNKSDCLIVFRRIPTIVIGQGDEKKQVVKLLKELAPIGYWDFFAAYEERYGVQKETAASGLYKYISFYLQNNVFDYAVPSIAPEDISLFSQRIKEKKLWLLPELEEMFNTVCVNSNEDALNYLTLRKIGYELSSGGYAYSREFASAQDCFESILKKDGIIDVNISIPHQVCGAFLGYIAKLDKSFDYVEVAPKKYMTKEKVYDTYGITEDEMHSFIKYVLEAQDDTFFNSISLKNIVRSHSLSEKCEFSNMICDSVLRKDESVYTTTYADSIIMSRTQEPTIVSVSEWIISSNPGISLNELEVRFKDLFGLNITASKIKEKLRQVGKYEKYFKESLDDYINQLDDTVDIDSFFDEIFD